MMSVLLESLHQSMDFATKSFTNTIVIRLPSGAKIELTVSEQVVAKLITEVAGVGTPAPPDPQAITTRPAYELGEDGVTSFGSVDQEVTQAEQPASLPSAPASKVKVTRDEYGNPVLTGRGFQDPSMIIGTDNGRETRDEDGVAQA